MQVLDHDGVEIGDEACGELVGVVTPQIRDTGVDGIGTGSRLAPPVGWLYAGRAVRPAASGAPALCSSQSSQDLHPAQWRLLRRAVARGADDLFIVSDPNQRIHDNRVSLARLDIEVRGRSTRLTPQRERCLLFVACTRARDALHVSHSGTASPFLL